MKRTAASMTRVANGEVTLPVTRLGRGQKLIIFNGLGCTQAVWERMIGCLEGAYEVVTFDFRSHGGASTGRKHDFEAFLSDAEAVMASVGSGRPIIVAWSLGADLAVAYAAAHPGATGGLVLIDGAVPLAEGLVEDAAGTRRRLNSLAMSLSLLLVRATPYRYSLSGDAIADVTLSVDAYRLSGLADAYARLDCPVTMLLATKSAGENRTDHARRNNRLWRESADRLTAAYPSIRLKWLDAGHGLPLTKPAEIAAEVDAFAGRLGMDRAS